MATKGLGGVIEGMMGVTRMQWRMMGVDAVDSSRLDRFIYLAHAKTSV